MCEKPRTVQGMTSLAVLPLALLQRVEWRANENVFSMQPFFVFLKKHSSTLHIPSTVTAAAAATALINHIQQLRSAELSCSVTSVCA